MQSLRRCIGSWASSYKSVINSATLSKPSIFGSNFHTSPKLQDFEDSEHENNTNKWLKGNEVIFPIQEPGEERRPAFVRHMKSNIKYSPKTMWYIACSVRGLSVDEAVKQLSFCLKKGAAAAKEVILEARDMAIKDHNVEFKSNLWVAESFSTRGNVVKGLRRHAKGRRGVIFYRYVNYYVTLEEGTPPKHYYLPKPQTKEELLENWLLNMRKRRVANTI